MINKIIEELNLKKVANLIEIIQKTKSIDEKIIAFQKIEKVKITKSIGLFLIESAKYDYKVEDGNGGINSSLISLCFKEYYDEYTPEIKKIFKYLSPDAQNRVVFLLSSIDNESSLKLYVDLVLKYYSKSTFIPISNLFERSHLYNILFPKLYKGLKFDYARNNILIIINDYLNAGVISDTDLKKNKKLIQDAIIKIFNMALSYKFKNTGDALRNAEYFDLRFFLEIAVNIEGYVSGKRTKDLLDKLFKKNDNQLNLFILENYINKGMDISKIKLDNLAKDDASRYPLFDILDAYGMTSLIPKRYCSGKMLAKSDFYINLMIYTKYKEDIKSFKLIDTRTIEGYRYYIFKFNYTYTYDNRPQDFATNYLMHQSRLDKYSVASVDKEFIGISGGYIDSDEPSLLAFNHKRLILSKIENDEEDVINKLLEEIKKDIIKEKNIVKKEEEKDKNVNKSNHKFHFSYILLFLFFVFISLLIACVIFSYDPDIIKVNKNISNYVSSSITEVDKFKEIDGNDIYNQAEEEYYVLLYKKGKNKKNVYYTYINEYIKNNLTVYYVNLNDEKNKFLYENNDLNFVIEKDRFLKVRDKDFEYYVDGKNNILKEMKNQINILNKEQGQNVTNKTTSK